MRHGPVIKHLQLQCVHHHPVRIQDRVKLLQALKRKDVDFLQETGYAGVDTVDINKKTNCKGKCQIEDSALHLKKL